MKVIFDHQLFSYQRYGGASKYFAMLLNALPREEWETTTIWSNNEYVKSLHLFKQRHFLYKYYFRGQGALMNMLNKPYSYHVLSKKEYDVFHQTHFETYCIPAIGNKPMVTTFHDINFSTLNPSPRIVRLQKKSLRRADAVIAISENTKKDLVELFKIDEKKVSVIYHGILLNNTPRKDLSQFPYPYILYVGSRGRHKNFNTFIKAYAIFHNKYPDIRLVCTYKPFTRAEYDLFKSFHVENDIVHTYADEDLMQQLYKNALFYIFPSLYEGFGMPILEAMANKCPVLLANASCFPEIAKNAGLYFDPNDIEEMSHKMSLLIENPHLRETYVNLGWERVHDFTWEKCAEEHRKVYQSLI